MTENFMTKYDMKIIALTLLTLTYAIPTQAQMTPQGSLSFGLGVPMGDFEQNVDQLGYGANLYLGLETSNSPIGVGIDVSFIAMGESTRSKLLDEGRSIAATTTNSVVQPHLVLRLQPYEGVVRPYLEGLFGFKYLYTRTDLHRPLDEESFTSSRNFDDFTLSGGGGAGIQIRVGQALSSFRATYLKLGIQYLLGGKADYPELNDRFDPESLQLQRSTTTMVIPMIGVTFQ